MSVKTNKKEENVGKTDNFKKEDFKFGDIITLRNKEQYIYTGNGIARTDEDKKMSLYCWKKNLEHENMRFLDIMKIERPQQMKYSKYYFESYALQMLYSRSENEGILDEREKEYLRNVIKPFRNIIQGIVKKTDYNDFGRYIQIDFRIKDGLIMFPTFKKDTMYKNMELDKEYTIEDLDL